MLNRYAKRHYVVRSERTRWRNPLRVYAEMWWYIIDSLDAALHHKVEGMCLSAHDPYTEPTLYVKAWYWLYDKAFPIERTH